MRASLVSSEVIWRISSRAGSGLIGAVWQGGLSSRPCRSVYVLSDELGGLRPASLGRDCRLCPRVVVRGGRRSSRARSWRWRRRRRLARAKALLFAAGRLAGFGERVGLELSPEVLLCGGGDRAVRAGGLRGPVAGDGPDAADEPAGAGAGGRALSAAGAGAAAPRAREGAVFAGGDRRVSAPGEARSPRRRGGCARARWCVWARARESSPESCVTCAAATWRRARAGCSSCVSGRRARSVPVLARYQEPLLEAAAFAGRELDRAAAESRGGATSPTSCAARLSADRSLPRLEPGRLRSTLASRVRASGSALARSCRPPGSAAASGWGTSPPSYPAASESELVALLGAGCAPPGADWLVLEKIVDTAGVSERIEARLPVGVRPRQLSVAHAADRHGAGRCSTAAHAHLTARAPGAAGAPR